VVGVGSNYTLFFERDNLARSDPRRTLTSLVLSVPFKDRPVL